MLDLTVFVPRMLLEVRGSPGTLSQNNDFESRNKMHRVTKETDCSGALNDMGVGAVTSMRSKIHM